MKIMPRMAFPVLELLQIGKRKIPGIQAATPRGVQQAVDSCSSKAPERAPAAGSAEDLI